MRPQIELLLVEMHADMRSPYERSLKLRRRDHPAQGGYNE